MLPWSSDPDGEALLLLQLGACRPGRVLGRSSDPDGEALFLLRFGGRRPRRAWLRWSSDPDGEALFLLHLGPRVTDAVWSIATASPAPGGTAISSMPLFAQTLAESPEGPAVANYRVIRTSNNFRCHTTAAHAVM